MHDIKSKSRWYAFAYEQTQLINITAYLGLPDKYCLIKGLVAEGDRGQWVVYYPKFYDNDFLFVGSTTLGTFEF